MTYICKGVSEQGRDDVSLRVEEASLLQPFFLFLTFFFPPLVLFFLDAVLGTHLCNR